MSQSRMRMPFRAALLARAVAVTCLASAASASAATLPSLSIAVTGTSASVGGTLESGAVNIVTSDSGLKEGAVILFLLKPTVGFAEAEAFVAEKKIKGDPNNSVKLGSIGLDVAIEPGEKNETQTTLQPGNYLVLVGAGEGEAEIRTHFTVTASKAPAALPTPEAKIRTVDFGFRGPTTLHDGELVAFENEGFVVHMDFAFPVKNMKNAKKAVKLLKRGKEKAVQKLIAGPPVGFAGPISHEALQQETITAKPGVYVQVCFMETQTGVDHARLGMERIIKITK
jgi:hypothetical protein